MRRAITGCVLGCLVLAAGLAAQQRRPQDIDLQAAIRTETVDRDLKKAIELYKAIADKYRGIDRAVAASALVHAAECYQKLGDAEAQRIFEQVLRDFSDQKEAATIARARLEGTKHAVDPAGVVNRQVWTGSEVNTFGSVSPDGRYLSFVAWDTGDLALRELATGVVRRVTNKGTWLVSLDFAEASTISRDGTHVAYSWYNDKTKRYDLRTLGLDKPGTPKVLLDNPDIAWLAPYDWSPDGRLLAVQVARKDRTAQIGVVDTEDGSFKSLKSIDWRGTTKMFFSPDGSLVAYDLPQSDEGRLRDVFVLSVDGSRELKAVEHPAADVVVGWSPDGRSLLFGSDRGGSLGLWSLAIHDGKLAGGPISIKPDIGALVASVGVTRGGSLLYGVRTSAATIAIATVDFESGKLLSEPSYPFEGYLTTFRRPDWSANGKRILVASGRVNATLHQAAVLAIYSVPDGRVREIRTRMNDIGLPRWAPDGSISVHGYDQNGRQGIYRIDPESGDSTAIVVSGPGVTSYRPLWLPDGRSFVYRRGEEGKVTLLVRNAASGEERKLVEGKLLQGLSISPDGQQITYTERGESSTSLHVMPVAGGLSRELVRASHPTVLTGGLVEWTPDGRQVVFRKGEGGRFSAWIVPAAGGTPRQLDPSFPATDTLRIHPDGRHVVFETGTDATEIWALENFLPAQSSRRQ